MILVKKTLGETIQLDIKGCHKAIKIHFEIFKFSYAKRFSINKPIFILMLNIIIKVNVKIKKLPKRYMKSP